MLGPTMAWCDSSRALDELSASFERERIGSLLRLPGNPFGVEMEHFGHATAFASRDESKVLGLGAESAEEVGRIAAFLARRVHRRARAGRGAERAGHAGPAAPVG
jgi:hypothetical protein